MEQEPAVVVEVVGRHERASYAAAASWLQCRPMVDLAIGTKVFDAAPVRGTWRMLRSPDDVLELMDTTADGVVACVADAGATFLAPIFDELTAVVCLSGTPQSHIGIVSREYQVPCVMGADVQRRRSRPTATRSRSTARARRASCGARRERARVGLDEGPRQPRDPVPQRDLAGAHVAAHRARVGADPGDRVHPRRVRRVLPALPGDDRGDRRRRRRPRSSAGPGIGSAPRSTTCTCGRSRTSR